MALFSTALQLFEQAEHAGHSVLTVTIRDFEKERSRLLSLGMKPGPIEEATAVRLFRLSDPDGNLIVLVEDNQK